MKTRVEKDSFGEIEVPADKYWGAQTQRSLQNFNIGDEVIPWAVIRALAIVKICAAKTNIETGVIKKNIGEAIIDAAQEIIERKLDGNFPLKVWQTGSGTQSNMNVNEVISNRASEMITGKINTVKIVHPNDHCNCSQSSNDSFPTAMHISALEQIKHKLKPQIANIKNTLKNKTEEFQNIIKIGRTHLQDATPITLGQEFSAYYQQIKNAETRIENASKALLPIAQGGTAVGTGINSKPQFADIFASKLVQYTKIDFYSAENKFEAIAAHDAFVEVGGALNTLAVSLFKIANDLRLLASGPRAGIGELQLPENEPGSSIMPGKVNPTQCEALTMVCVHVIACNNAVTFAASQGHFQLNAYKPVIIFEILKMIQLLADACHSFEKNCLKDIKPNLQIIKKNLQNSLMLVTALVPVIGYDKAAQIAKAAHQNGTTLKQEAKKLKYLTNEQFDKIVKPENMIAPK